VKKKKVGFWQKVRNIYNDSPWLAAFVYPIIYIIVAGILSSAFAMLGSSNVISELIKSFLRYISVVTATLKTYTDFMNIKNPYFPENDAVRFDGSNTSKSDRGYINLSSSGSNVIIKTCYGRICTDSAYRLSKTIEIK
jgi:hypothetical protein|tara:strand:- start:331 stop:744 length:414 start_codon:yes stop_codon:yes gene_type:complete